MFLSALVSLLVVAAPTPEGWSTYANERYGYTIGIPAGLEGQGESGNGDGQEFKSAAGDVSLKVWAAQVMELEGEPEGKTNLAWQRRTSLARWRKQGIRVTYQPKGKGWFVLSGEDAKGRVLYLKHVEKDGVLYGFEWSHPQGARTWQDATGAIAKSFKLP
ncbi:hypothetical protein [Hyalangium gracile]|uniref:hypothetical protein n=1 Tax=Hyalangium gracile TaxID=394092 RepID=UPI001CD03A32|nr:hypothetical protein [Hyalangium gracile]